MEHFSREELAEALRALDSLSGKCEKSREKLAVGTAQHTLLKNRIRALQIASSLIKRELEQG